MTKWRKGDRQHLFWMFILYGVVGVCLLVSGFPKVGSAMLFMALLHDLADSVIKALPQPEDDQ